MFVQLELALEVRSKFDGDKGDGEVSSSAAQPLGWVEAIKLP
jgi:hypothetical protein